MWTCIECEHSYDSSTGDTDERMCHDCMYDFEEQYKHKNNNSKNSVKAWKKKQIKLAEEWIRNFKRLCKKMNL